MPTNNHHIINKSEYLNKELEDLENKKAELEKHKKHFESKKEALKKAYEDEKITVEFYKKELLKTDQKISKIYSELTGISNEIIAILKMDMYLS